VNRTDLVPNLQRLLAGVGSVERLVVGEAIDVLIVLLIYFKVVLPITIILEVVKQAEQYLECDETIGASLMLGAHSDDVELLGNLIEPTIEVEAVHEGLNVEHVGDVVLEKLFEKLARRWQVLVHHKLD
jgi:hypothetical protein